MNKMMCEILGANGVMDYYINGENERRIYIQEHEPTTIRIGDVWFEGTEEDFKALTLNEIDEMMNATVESK